MLSKKRIKLIKNCAFSLFCLAAATIICLIAKANDSFATSIFILAVANVARFTDGYGFGIAASLAGTICVNYIFTYPFWTFNISVAGNLPTFFAMLVVSFIISTLTTQIKRQEQLHFEIEKEKMHANLLRAVSHDLRTPLTSILGASSVLMDNDGLSSTDTADLAREINKDARWLVRMTENLLSVTKLQGSDVAIKKDAEVVEEVVGSAIVKFRKTHTRLPINVTRPEEILLAPMDVTLIEQVLINLFENVVMHAKTATQITVDTRAADGKVIFTVEDDGVGIPSQFLPRIFDGYVHEDNGQSDIRRNMGIGLSVCRSIIQAHGGNIHAYNRKEGGAGISFYLPCEEDEHEN